MALTPQQVVEAIRKDSLFASWNTQHTQNFLSHLFCTISADYTLSGDWEVGFFNTASGKISVFVLMENGNIAVKPEDEVFKKPDMAVEKLKLDEVKLSLEQAIAIAKIEFPTRFPKEVLGDGFVVVQTFEQQTIWNFTFITKALAFANVKIDAAKGKINSADAFSVLDQGK